MTEATVTLILTEDEMSLLHLALLSRRETCLRKIDQCRVGSALDPDYWRGEFRTTGPLLERIRDACRTSARASA